MQPRSATLPNLPHPAEPPRPEAAGAVRSGATDWRWSRPALGAIVLLAAFLNLFRLDHEGYSNSYYAAAIKSMLQSWHNFFFVSFDPGGFVSIDKPPLGFWIQAAFARIFGFGGVATILPQALAGVLSVALLYHLVARSFGAPAALIAALCLAVSPISVVANRNNIIDSQLVLVVLLAAWAAMKATESGRLRPLLLCAALIGLGFNIKMLQAYLVVPACGLLYLLAAPRALGTRLAHLALALVVLLAVSFAWVATVDLTPASQRPYVGSSCNNSELNLALGYNGLGRLTGDIFSSCGSATSGGGGGGYTTGETGSAGPLRLFGRELGSQIGWLLPLTIVGLIAAAAQTRLRLALDRGRWRLPLDARQQALLLWGVWLATCATFFSVADFFHTYYLVMLAPAIAALSGIGAVALWLEHGRADWRRWLLPAALIAVGIVQAILLRPFPDWNHWLTPLIVGLSVLAALLLAAGGLLRRFDTRLGLAAAVVGFGALLAAPTTWAAYSVDHASGGLLPRSGPTASGGSGLFGGLPGGGELPASLGAGLPDGSGLPGGSGGSGIGSFGEVDRGLLRYLEAHQGRTTYLLAVTNATSAAPYILATGKPVMALGGFLGSDPILTTTRLAVLVRHNTVRYFQLMGGGFAGGTPPAALLEQLPAAMREMIEARGGKGFGGGGFGGFGSDRGLDAWVTTNCATVPVSAYQAAGGAAPGVSTGGFGFGAGQLYDCARHPSPVIGGAPATSNPDSSETPGTASTGGPLPALRKALAAISGYRATAITSLGGLGGPGGQGAPGGGGLTSTVTITVVRKAHGFAAYAVATIVTPMGKSVTETITYRGKVCTRTAHAGPFTCKAAAGGNLVAPPAGGAPGTVPGGPGGASGGLGGPGGSGGLGIPQATGDPSISLESATFSPAAAKTIGAQACDGYAYRDAKGARGTLYVGHTTHLPCEQEATASVQSFTGNGTITTSTTITWSAFGDRGLGIPASPIS